MPSQIKLDLRESGDDYLLQAELPGVAKEDIHVDVHGKLVTLKAEIRQFDSQNKDERALRSERYYGSVSRTVELPVEVAPDHWIDALPLPGTFVVNIGELLELASNGYLRATVHRVVPSAPGQERLSIAFFLGAQLDAVVPVYPLPEALAREARGPATDPHNPLLREVGWNYLKGRLRSHPDVALRHHADLLPAPRALAVGETTH